MNELKYLLSQYCASNVVVLDSKLVHSCDYQFFSSTAVQYPNAVYYHHEIRIYISNIDVNLPSSISNRIIDMYHMKDGSHIIKFAVFNEKDFIYGLKQDIRKLQDKMFYDAMDNILS